MNNFKYKTSKDYNRLVELMKDQTVICIVAVNGPVMKRRVLVSSWNAAGYKRYRLLSANNNAWHYEENSKNFIKQCKELNLEYIDPKANT